MRISYGVEVAEENDPYVTAVEEGVATFNLAFVPGAFLVETFPSLMRIPSWFPGGGFKRTAAAWQKIAHNMRDAPFEKTMEAMVSRGDQNSCIGLLMISNATEQGHCGAFNCYRNNGKRFE